MGQPQSDECHESIPVPLCQGQPLVFHKPQLFSLALLQNGCQLWKVHERYRQAEPPRVHA